MEQLFGDYELVRYLTAGGMADLYLARSPMHDLDLVIKRIQPRYLDHTRVVKMFIDEGRIAQVLDHPNIVKVLDVGNLQGTYYIAMEYIHGHDLIAIVRRGVEAGRFLPRGIAVGIINQVATGLAYAHSRCDASGRPLSIVHCDISPGNVVVSLRGTAKIVDFGIARATIALREQDGVAGKYNYMAPEQIKGHPIDARSDLFSLGVILYELTVGRRLFKGRPEVVMRKVCDEPILRPREVRHDFPEVLERIIGRLLARDPEERYATAAELRTDLRAYLRTLEYGWGKREIARYLRDLFRAPRLQAAGEEEEGGDDDDEELNLERAMPEIDEPLEVDPDEEAEDLSEAFSYAYNDPPSSPSLAVAAALAAVAAPEALVEVGDEEGGYVEAPSPTMSGAEPLPPPPGEPQLAEVIQRPRDRAAVPLAAAAELSQSLRTAPPTPVPTPVAPPPRVVAPPPARAPVFESHVPEVLPFLPTPVPEPEATPTRPEGGGMSYGDTPPHGFAQSLEDRTPTAPPSSQPYAQPYRPPPSQAGPSLVDDRTPPSPQPPLLIHSLHDPRLDETPPAQGPPRAYPPPRNRPGGQEGPTAFVRNPRPDERPRPVAARRPPDTRRRDRYAVVVGTAMVVAAGLLLLAYLW